MWFSVTDWMAFYEKDCIFFQQQCHILFLLTNKEEYEY